MKNIRDIKTIDEVLETLKELYIANMTQLAILQHRVNKTDKEQIANLERKLKNEVETIIYSDELETSEKIQYIRAAIECTYNLDDKNIDELEDIYVSAMIQKAISSNRLNYDKKEEIQDEDNEQNNESDEIDANKVALFEQQLENNIEELTKSAQTDEKKKQILKIAIEDINMVKESDVKDKIEAFSKEYLQRLMKTSNNIKGISKDEKAILKLIEQIGVKIHDDKDITDIEDCNYGDLVKDRSIKKKLIFQNTNMLFKRLAQFNVGKSIRNNDDNNIISRIENKNVTQYEFVTLSKRGEMISLDFFGEDNLEQQLHEQENYLPYILAAIAKAKEEGRGHIGKITILDKDLGTAVVRYDDKLETRVKELKERNENKCYSINQTKDTGNRE